MTPGSRRRKGERGMLKIGELTKAQREEGQKLIDAATEALTALNEWAADALAD